MKILFSSFVVACLVIACGSNEPILPEPPQGSGGASVSSSSSGVGGCPACETCVECPVDKDGTRLVRRKSHVASKDGLDAIDTLGVFHDNSLGLECRARLSEYGDVRCLPEPMVLSTFSDAMCSQPLIPADVVPCGSDVYVSRAAPSPACGDPKFAVWRVSASYSGAFVRSRDATGACVDTPNPGTFRSLLHVSALDFVALDITSL